MDRRDFLGMLASLGTLQLAACGQRQRQSGSRSTTRSHCPGIAQAASGTGAGGEALGAAERAAIEAACARLIPSDRDPGAREAGVIDYIERELATTRFAGLREELLAGARKLDVLATRLGASSFGALTAEKQDQVLGQMQRGMRLGRRYRSEHFLMVLLIFTLEGFLGDPVYGGNRDGAGWRLIGFEPRPPRPRCAYRGLS